MKNLLCTKFSLPRQKALTSGCVCSHPVLGATDFPEVGAPTPKLVLFFWRKLHENERIWTPRLGSANDCSQSLNQAYLT